jgi:hypothetical protein
MRVFDLADHIALWYPVVPLAFAVLGLAIAASWARRGDWLAATAATGATALLVSPISWSHHWVWIVPALALLLRDGRRAAALAAYALFLLSPMWWTPHGGVPLQYGFHGLLTAFANAYLIAALAFLAFLAHSVLALRRTEHLLGDLDPLPRAANRIPL